MDDSLACRDHLLLVHVGRLLRAGEALGLLRCLGLRLLECWILLEVDPS